MSQSKPSRNYRTALSVLSEELSYREFATYFSPLEEGTPLEQVVVTLGQWDDHLLIMKFVSLLDLRLASGVTAGDILEPEVLHGTLVLPFEIGEEQVEETSRAVFLYNRLLPIGSFGVSPKDRLCYFQTAITVEPASELPAATAFDVTQRASYALEAYGKMIAQVASGTISTEDCRSQLVEQGLEPKSLQRDDLSLDSFM